MNHNKSSRYRPKSKRKKRYDILKEEEEDVEKQKYVIYKDKCVICMVITALIIVSAVNQLKTEKDDAASVPQLFGRMNNLIDELDKETNHEFGTMEKNTRKPIREKKGWQLWNVTYHGNMKLTAHLYQENYEPSNIFDPNIHHFYVGFGYPVVINFEFLKVPKKPIVAYKIGGHPTRLLEKQNPGHWLFFGSYRGTPPWLLLDERHVGPSFLSKGLLRSSAFDGVILCFQYPRTRLKSIRMKIVSNSGWHSQMSAISKVEFLTEDQHKHCKHRMVDQTIGQIHKNAGTQGAVFTSSSLIEDHGPEHVDDKSPKTYWETSLTQAKLFPVWIQVDFVKPVQIFSYHISRTESIEKSPAFFRLVGYTSRAANRKTDLTADAENIGFTLDERVLQGSTSLKTILDGGTHYCVYPNHHGQLIKRVRLNIFRVFGQSDEKATRQGVSVALSRFFITTHEEEEESLGSCTDRR
eukprot:g7746.t1